MSGKTEAMLELVSRAALAGNRVCVLVPNANSERRCREWLDGSLFGMARGRVELLRAGVHPCGVGWHKFFADPEWLDTATDYQLEIWDEVQCTRRLP